jgi:DNA-damage-inducible protein D
MTKNNELPSIGANSGSDIRKVWHNEEWHFSIVDVISWATGRNYPGARLYWNSLKKELKKAGSQLVGLPHQLKMPAADGKMRLTDAGTTQLILRIIQEIPGPKTNEIKDWLATVGAERLEETEDPEGYEEKIVLQDQDDTDEAYKKRQERRIAMYRAMGRDDAWIMQREFGIVTRREFTLRIKELLGTKANYGQLTNDIYRGVHHRSASQLRDDLGIKSSQNPRDHMHCIGLHYIFIAEAAAEVKMQDLREEDAVPPKLVREIIVIVAKQIGMQADELALALGIDLVTGKPLLPGNVYEKNKALSAGAE